MRSTCVSCNLVQSETIEMQLTRYLDGFAISDLVEKKKESKNGEGPLKTKARRGEARQRLNFTGEEK